MIGALANSIVTGRPYFSKAAQGLVAAKRLVRVPRSGTGEALRSAVSSRIGSTAARNHPSVRTIQPTPQVYPDLFDARRLKTVHTDRAPYSRGAHVSPGDRAFSETKQFSPAPRRGEKRGYALFRDLHDKIASGRYGSDARRALYAQSIAMEGVQGTIKSAVADDSGEESDNDRRLRRLAELVRRRKKTGLHTGSTSPRPPQEQA